MPRGTAIILRQADEFFGNQRIDEAHRRPVGSPCISRGTRRINPGVGSSVNRRAARLLTGATRPESLYAGSTSALAALSRSVASESSENACSTNAETSA